MFLSGHQTVKWRSFFQNQRCTRHCERRTHCLLLVGIEWVWICSLLWKKMKERMKDVILYNTKNDVSLPLISPRLIVFSLLFLQLFFCHISKEVPRLPCCWVLLCLFLQRDPRSWRSGTSERESYQADRLCIMLTLWSGFQRRGRSEFCAADRYTALPCNVSTARMQTVRTVTF